MIKAFVKSFFGTTKKSDFDSVEHIENAPASVEEGQLAVDIYHDADTIFVTAPLAGVSMDDISITIDDDILTIKGARVKPDRGDDIEYYVQECFWGAFSRSIILPVAANPDKIEATFENGILIVGIPKDTDTKRKVVKIKSKKAV